MKRKHSCWTGLAWTSTAAVVLWTESEPTYSLGGGVSGWIARRPLPVSEPLAMKAARTAAVATAEGLGEEESFSSEGKK